MLKHKIKQIYISYCLILVVVFMAGCGNKSQAVIITESTFDEGVEQITEFDDASEQELQEVVEAKEEYILVYVCGAVVNPGVYQLKNTDIKNTALMMAGGYADGAATTYVNLAQTIEEGEKIYFPYEYELEQGIFQEDINLSDEKSDKININTATKDELMTLSGIGESKACDIIAYREEHGGFESIEEIMNINGIKEGVYNKIKDFIVVY